jgi:hypothetical protein
MQTMTKEQLLKNLKAVIRQMKLLNGFKRPTAQLAADSDTNNIEYNALIKHLVTKHNMTPEQIAIEISKKDTVV